MTAQDRFMQEPPEKTLFVGGMPNDRTTPVQSRHSREKSTRQSEYQNST